MRFHPILDKKCNLWKLRKRFFAHKESNKGQVKGGIQMAKRGENIHKRKDGRWEGRYIKGRTADEKPIWGYLYGYAYGIVKDNLMKRKVPDWGEQTTLPFSQNDPRPQIFNHPRPTSDCF